MTLEVPGGTTVNKDCGIIYSFIELQKKAEKLGVTVQMTAVRLSITNTKNGNFLFSTELLHEAEIFIKGYAAGKDV